MIFLEHTRFVIDVQEQDLQAQKARYHEEFDHTEKVHDNQTDLDRLRRHAKVWLKDHYGYITIFFPNSYETKPILIKICNHKKFKRDMHNMGVGVIKQSKKIP